MEFWGGFWMVWVVLIHLRWRTQPKLILTNIFWNTKSGDRTFTLEGGGVDWAAAIISLVYIFDNMRLTTASRFAVFDDSAGVAALHC